MYHKETIAMQETCSSIEIRRNTDETAATRLTGPAAALCKTWKVVHSPQVQILCPPLVPIFPGILRPRNKRAERDIALFVDGRIPHEQRDTIRYSGGWRLIDHSVDTGDGHSVLRGYGAVYIRHFYVDFAVQFGSRLFDFFFFFFLNE